MIPLIIICVSVQLLLITKVKRGTALLSVKPRLVLYSKWGVRTQCCDMCSLFTHWLSAHQCNTRILQHRSSYMHDVVLDSY
jgi:hypothetical protein